MITVLYVRLVPLSCFRPYSLNVRFNSQINMAVSVTVRNTTNTRKASPSLWHNLLPSLVWIFSSGRRLIVPNSVWSTENKNRVTVESVAKQETCLGGANKGEIYAAREMGYGPLAAESGISTSTGGYRTGKVWERPYRKMMEMMWVFLSSLAFVGICHFIISKWSLYPMDYCVFHEWGLK